MEIFNNISISMWIIFLIGIAIVLVYSVGTKNKENGVHKYMQLTIRNVSLHVLGSLAVFLTLEESGEYLIHKIAPDFTGGNGYQLLLSLFSGMLGSTLLMGIYESAKSIFNKLNFK